MKHFIFTLLRDAFCTALLNEMEPRIGASFKSIKASIYARHKKFFYVKAKPNTGTSHHAIKYISRYLGRPVIASSRIDNYDSNFFTFHYKRHEDNKFIKETVPVMEFIAKLIQHIPEKHFKMIRYYGIYTKHHPQEKHFLYSISKEKHPYFKSLNYWRLSIMASFGCDPLECSNCGNTMEIMEIWYRKTALVDQLRKVLGKSP